MRDWYTWGLLHAGAWTEARISVNPLVLAGLVLRVCDVDGR